MRNHRIRSWHRRQGSIMVESAIVLPVFILALVTLACLIHTTWVQTMVFSTAVDESRQASALRMPVRPSSVRAALEKEGLNGERLTAGVSYGSAYVTGIPDLQRLRVSYEIPVQMPIPFVRNISLDSVVLTRPWTGKLCSGEPMPFESMAQEDDGYTVTLFPRAGGKYHVESCRYVKSYPQEVSLSASVRKKYSPCPLCTEGGEPDGQMVCIFRYGSAYHKKSCSSVTRYVIRMDRKDAEKRGYRPCSVCGGGD